MTMRGVSEDGLGYSATGLKHMVRVYKVYRAYRVYRVFLGC